MTGKSRGFGQNSDWDPMTEDYNNSMNDSQYSDDEGSGGMKLMPSRLYITNIPHELTEDGLRASFSKFGTLTEVYLSRDPSKKFGLLRYETPGEAKFAMTKMNHTPPLNLNVSIAKKPNSKNPKDRERMNSNNRRERGNYRDDASGSSRGHSYRNQNDMTNGNNMEDLPMADDEMGMEDAIDPELHLELENLRLEQLKVREEQLQCKHRMLLLKQADKRTSSHNTSNIHCVLPDGRIVVRNLNNERSAESRDGDVSFGAGDSKENTVCSCKAKMKTWDQPTSSEDGSSTPSTCVLCSEDRSDSTHTKREYQDKSDLTSKVTDTSKKSGYSSKIVDSKTTNITQDSKMRTDFSKHTVSKRSDTTSKKFEIKKRSKSEVTYDFKYSDFYSDSEDEADETNRLIQLRNSDYMDIVEDELKLVIALAGYPKSKMRLRQMELFQKSLTDVIDMQLKSGLLKNVPTFLDYYLNRGALVCICKDLQTRDWMVRISPGLQERMSNNLVLLKAKVKRLCLAVLKIPQCCWPATAQDAFKLLQYFNPDLKTDSWKIYAQKSVEHIECTSFLIDRVSGEIIRGPNFKNVIDYDQMEFELTGYTEIYYECLLSDMDEDLSSIASRVKLLQEIKSEKNTPRNTSDISVRNTEKAKGDSVDCARDTTEDNIDVHVNSELKIELDCSLQQEVLDKLKDVKYISDKDEVLVWSDETINYSSDHENEKPDHVQISDNCTGEEVDTKASTSVVAISDNTESIIESNDNLMSRNSNVNIDSNRGIAYHRRTNYLQVDNELKVAITLEGYPQNKLEGTHIRRLKHLFKDYLHKDMKQQRFTNLIIPKFQDIYLSNGAVIYICDSLETKDYLTEVLFKFINSTGLKLTFRDITNLVRYTRLVMRLPKELANIESLEILLKLKAKYPGLKPDCWKYYSHVAGKQKRQFGVDPESLEVIKSPDFDPTYEGEKLSFRVIDRQKRDISIDEGNVKDDEDSHAKKQKDTILKNMYVSIDQDIINAPLSKIRTYHYSNLIPDDLKLYVGPSNYPEMRIDEAQFHSIKRTFEAIVCKSIENRDLTDETMPKFHDMYLFDGVIFIICQNMASRKWMEQTVSDVNAKLNINLKSTEFRGAVGIISMVVKTDKNTDDVIAILQKQNPRLRTKYWRKISTVRSKTKLDVVLQIDKLSAQVIASENFNKFIDNNAVEFKLGHLQSLLKPKESLEALIKVHAQKKTGNVKSHKTRSKKVSMQKKSIAEIKKDSKRENLVSKTELHANTIEHAKSDHNICMDIDENTNVKNKEDTIKMGDENVLYTATGCQSDLDPIIFESESLNTVDTDFVVPENQGYCKVILTIPLSILPDHKEDLNIIFDLLEDKNPGLNTELWQVYTETAYPNNGKFTLFADKQSVAIIRGKTFDPSIGGEKLKFYF